MNSTQKQKGAKGFPYIERDESWMYFNRRILFESQRKDIPLLERLNFLGIYSSNLDEFFRVRVASLRRFIEFSQHNLLKEKKLAQSVLKKIYSLDAAYSKIFRQSFEELRAELKAEGIEIVDEQELSPAQQAQVLAYYQSELNGLANPIFLRHMDFDSQLQDDTIYLAVQMRSNEAKASKPTKHHKKVAIIELPVKQLGRFVLLPNSSDAVQYIMFIDDIIRFCLPYIFSGLPYTDFEAYAFKFTKDAEMEMDSDLQKGVMQKVLKAIKSRQSGEAIRIVYDEQMPAGILRRLTKKADFNRDDARRSGGRYHNLKDLMNFPSCGRHDLQKLALPPIYKASLPYSQSMIAQILKHDLALHFPYHSFDHVVQLLREAAISEEVTAIKISLYRTAKQSKIVKALLAAARNKKKVTVVIELLARFDEASNIHRSNELQDAGAKVLFGPEGLKIHSKLIHISTRHGDIAAVSTGNFHEHTAKLYTDYMLLTHQRSIVREVERVFDYIERPFISAKFKELIVSPNDTRSRFFALINNEIKNKALGKEAYIRIKINHISDRKMIEKLYEASSAGVQVDLLLRGNCSIKPGVKGLSENIRINAIIDNFLEHSRIFIFANAGKELYFIGSADWMTRNLDRRIEVTCPVYDPSIQADLKRVIELGMNDTAHGHFVNSHHNMPRRSDADEQGSRSQTALYAHYLAAEAIIPNSDEQ